MCVTKRNKGRFEKKDRVVSTPSTLPAPEGAPEWTKTTVNVQGGTPHGGTGVGAHARRIIRDQYTIEDIVNSVSSPDTHSESESYQ